MEYNLVLRGQCANGIGRYDFERRKLFCSSAILDLHISLKGASAARR